MFRAVKTHNEKTTKSKTCATLQEAVKFASGRYRSVKITATGEVRHVQGKLLGYVEPK